MAESRWTGGLAARLAIVIGTVVVLAFAATFVAVYRGTGSRVHAQIHSNLNSSAATIRGSLLADGAPTATEAQQLARRAIAAQPTFGPSSILFVVQVPGRRPVTNEPELLGLRPPGGSGDETPADQRREAGEARAILQAPPGYSTTHLEDAGGVDLLSSPLALATGRAAKITVGSPLQPVADAQNGVQRAFLIAGGIALAVVLGAVLLIAVRTTAPLREMERTAAAVDAGEPSVRMPERGARETRHLARSFNHMLDRIHDYVARQRQFVADASHELRTPLTAIRGQAEVLGRGPSPGPESVHETTERISGQVERMDRLIDDMLLLARADEDGIGRVETVEVGELVEQALGALPPQARAHVRAEGVPHGSVPGDPDQLTRALINVVQNATEHIGAEGHVVVSTSGGGAGLRLVVDDDGPGILPAERALVFERFHRSDAARDRRAGGSGLGLAITRAIVEAHGGRVWADESPLGGARIVIELPGMPPGRAQS